MATKKKTDQEDLYICMYDINTKRKYLLSALKNSLILQEESEKISEIRSAKKECLKKIKENIDKINKKYTTLKKLLPNVKNVLSYTEKELIALDSSIETLKGSIKTEKEIIRESEKFKKTLKRDLDLEEVTIDEDKFKKTTSKKKAKEQLKRPSSKKLTKIDRIKNNLSIIEEKLKTLK